MKTTLRRVLNIVFTFRTLLNMVSALRRGPQGLLKKPTTAASATSGWSTIADSTSAVPMR